MTRSPARSATKTSTTAANRSRRRSAVEPLEERRLLSVTTGGLSGTEFDEVQVPSRLQEVQHLTPLGDEYYLFASDVVHGGGVWKTDGTTEGTTALLTGLGSSLVYNLTPVGDLMYFMVDSSLWVSGGTAETTRRLARLSEGFAVFPTYPARPASPAALASFSDDLYFSPSPSIFSSFSGDLAAELWKTGATPEDLILVKDIRPGPESSHIQFLQVAGDELFFVADDGVHGAELWATDGTTDGTRLVKDIRPGSSELRVRGSIALGDRLFFIADDGIHGGELWTSDGTESGTYLVRDINEGYFGSDPVSLTVADGQLFLVADDGVHGSEVWRTDGTESGTRMVADLTPGTTPDQNDQLTRPTSLLAAGDRIYFTLGDADARREIWQTDGTAEGTRRVWHLTSDSNFYDGHFWVSLHGVIDGELYFSIGSSEEQNELRRLVGTSGASQLVAEINAYGINPLATGGFLFAGSKDLPPGAPFLDPSTLWISNGTPSGTHVLQPDVPQHLVAGETLLVGDRLYFVAWTATFGRELWWTDGHKHGIHQVTDIRPGAGNSNPSQLTEVAGSLYFVAYDEEGQNALWRIAPGSNEAVLVKAGGTYWLTSFDGALYYTVNARQLWRSDEFGTTLVTQFSPSETSISIRELVAAGDFLYFVLDDGGIFGTEKLRELWRTDGTDSGTQRIAENLASKWSDVYLPYENQLFFSKADGSLWKTDGTPAGTVEVRGGFVGESLNSITNVNGTIYFSADDGVHGHELWKTDGTTEGSVLVADIVPGEGSSYPSRLTNVNGKLFFLAQEAVYGHEVWQSDGTWAGTRLVKDIRPGSMSAGVQDLFAAGELLYFSADDGIHGRELWRTDGTVDGTTLVADVHPGSAGSYPRDFALKDDFVFFTADNGINGRELWRTAGTESTTVRLVYAESNQPDGLAVFDRATNGFFVKYQPGGGSGDAAFQFGSGAMATIPLMGDWDGDGLRTPGLYDPASGTFFLRNTLDSGSADHVIRFGPPGAGWQPLVGDWDGDRRATIGFYSGDAFFLRNELAGGLADLIVDFGPAGSGWTAVVGDWTGDGTTSVGLYAQGTFFLKHDLTGGHADATFQFGPAGQGFVPLAGDWNGNGIDSIGLYAQGATFLRHHNGPGAADQTFLYGPSDSGWMPLVGPSSKRLDAEEIQSVVDAVLERLELLGVEEPMLDYLSHVRFVVSNVGAPYHASPLGTTIVDPTAAGEGWFVDPTPWSDEEYLPDPDRPGKLVAREGTTAENRIDLFNAVLGALRHEARHFGSFVSDLLGYFARFEPGERDALTPELVAEHFSIDD